MNPASVTLSEHPVAELEGRWLRLKNFALEVHGIIAQSTDCTLTL